MPDSTRSATNQGLAAADAARENMEYGVLGQLVKRINHLCTVRKIQNSSGGVEKTEEFAACHR